jgi:hypothetical protein
VVISRDATAAELDFGTLVPLKLALLASQAGARN